MRGLRPVTGFALCVWSAALLGGPLAGIAAAAPLTFVVNQIGNQSDNVPDGLCDVSAAEGSQCTLRGAIQEANLNPGPDTISFQLASPYRIAPATPLPAITSPVLIDGTALTGYSPAAGVIVRLDGVNLGGDGLAVVGGGDGSTITGLEMARWTQAIRLSSDSSIVAGNYLGVRGNGSGTCTGPTGPCTNSYGVLIQDGSMNRVGGTTAAARNVISNNSYGVWITTESGNSNANVVEGNYIGTNHTGTVALGNSVGIWQYAPVSEGPTLTVIGGTTAGSRNLISGNGSVGVLIQHGTATIAGNYVGTTTTGAAAIPNSDGVRTEAGSGAVIVGGPTVASRNVISGNSSNGVSANAGGEAIANNYIGTDGSGLLPLGNGGHGVYVAASAVSVSENVVAGNLNTNIQVSGCPGCVPASGVGVTIESNVVGLAADGATELTNGFMGVALSSVSESMVSGNTIGGHEWEGLRFDASVGVSVLGNRLGTDVTGALDRGNSYGAVISSTVDVVVGQPGNGNVFSGNDLDGLLLDGATADAAIQGNLFGTDVDGESPLPNDRYGLHLAGVDSNRIGGALAGEANVVSGNAAAGVVLSTAGNNDLLGNLIGVAQDGVMALPNGGEGVALGSGSANNRIGTTDAGSGNVIAYNGAAGSFLPGVAIIGQSNAVRGNSIHSNAGLGIDLGPDGVTANDVRDVDAGPNRYQNFPMLTSSGSGIGGTQVKGTLNSRPNRTYELDFFESASCDISGHGQGTDYLGSTTLTTDGNGDATFTLVLASQVAGGAQVTATATDAGLRDTSEFSPCVVNVGIPSVSISPAAQTVPEDTGHASYTVSLSGVPSLSPVTVNIATTDGTASAGSDYNAVSQTLTFTTTAPQTVNVPIADDVIDESDEAFTVALSGADNAFVDPAAAESLTSISDNDVTPQFSISPGTLTVDEGAGTASFTVTLSGDPLLAPATVDVTSGDETATGGSDYNAVTTTLSFPAGGSQTVDVTIIDDVLDETDETFTVTLSGPTAATLATGQEESTATITDNDTTPEFTISPASSTVAEGAGLASFTVTLSGDPLVSPATVDVGTADGTATAGSDYTTTTTTLSFTAAGMQTVDVPIANDATDEVDETFTVTLSNPTNATLGVATQSTATIEDDDLPPTLTVVNPANTFEGLIQSISVTLSAASAKTVTVLASTEGETAVAGLDYETEVVLLTFAPGQTSHAVPVTLIDDPLDEFNETYRLELFSPSNATIQDGTGTALIRDNDPTPTITLNDVTITEGDAGFATAQFTVTLSALSGREVRVTATTSDGSASAPRDYGARNVRLRILAGSTSALLNVNVRGDTLVEAAEDFFVTLSSPAGAIISDFEATGTIIDDD